MQTVPALAVCDQLVSMSSTDCIHVLQMICRTTTAAAAFSRQLISPWNRSQSTSHHHSAIIAFVYRPGFALFQQLFFDELGAVLEQLATYLAPVYIAGDFNICLDTSWWSTLHPTALDDHLLWTDAASHRCHAPARQNTWRCDYERKHGLPWPCRRRWRQHLWSPAAVLGSQRYSRHAALCTSMLLCLASSWFGAVSVCSFGVEAMSTRWLAWRR